MKFAITHPFEHLDSPFITTVSQAWPMVVSNLKSLLETGKLLSPQGPDTQLEFEATHFLE